MKFDGINWANVGNAGFSSDIAEYTSLAFSPSGKPYVAYRDYGNSYKATVMKYDSIYVGLNELQQSKLSCYPNPASDFITIETHTKGQVSIINIHGQELLKQTITEPKTLVDISSLPNGIYFVRVMGEKTVGVGKVIKQ